MARKKKSKNHDDHVDESWLIPYADLLTLLLALFVVLFASSSIDAEKMKQFASSFNEAFDGGTGVLDETSSVPPAVSNDSLPKGANTEEGNSPNEELSGLQQKVDEYISNSGLHDKLQTTLSDDGLKITILNDVFFTSGSAEVQQANYKVAQDISKLLVINPPKQIVIAGYTDNVPISNANFSSNWELSSMRALNFMKVLLENKKLNPQWFSVRGYGQYHPIASNDTSEGREKNRRVEILITPSSKPSE
ncbi:flagellar motor protein MotB [Priestia endophytica]|uniref:flagellar motor protein MotB n=1 Tax=Priestia endophytica TaxID=135735 RepID=UPI000DCA4C47|nr:flagellar motor protein MotB [Priestia endophytica]RAS78517.1 flagellar motor protein MotB [Priestia endophytica]